MRTHHELVITAKVDFGVYFDEVNVTEVETACFTLRLVSEVDLSSLIVESDLLTAI